MELTDFLILEKNMKSIFESKTVWFNVIMTIIGIVIAFQGIPALQAWSAFLAGILAVGNVILRVWFTTTAIGTVSAGPSTPNA